METIADDADWSSTDTFHGGADRLSFGSASPLQAGLLCGQVLARSAPHATGLRVCAYETAQPRVLNFSSVACRGTDTGSPW
jgi:hypothetical protein